MFAIIASAVPRKEKPRTMPRPLDDLIAADAKFAPVTLDRTDEDWSKSKTAPEGPFASNGLAAGACYRSKQLRR